MHNPLKDIQELVKTSQSGKNPIDGNIADRYPVDLKMLSSFLQDAREKYGETAIQSYLESYLHAMKKLGGK